MPVSYVPLLVVGFLTILLVHMVLCLIFIDDVYLDVKFAKTHIIFCEPFKDLYDLIM